MMNHKKLYLMSACVFGTLTLTQAQTAKDSLSYALGVDIGRSLKQSGFDLDLNTLSNGLTAFYQGENLLFDEGQVSAIIQQHIQAMMEKRSAELKKPGEAFLAALKDKPTVKATPEGVLYEVLVEGTGNQPKATDEVKVHYAGYLISGEKFDSSYDRGEPISLHLDQVIEGWKIGLPLMKVGAKYKLYVPYDLAYGERETGSIPPFSALIFEIELLDIIQPNEI